MISKMSKYAFVMLKGDREAFIEKLAALGVMDIRRSSKPIDDRSAALLDGIRSIREEIATIEKGSDAHLSALKAEAKELARTMDSVAVWGEYDREKLASTGLKIRFYVLKESKFNPAWAEEYAIQEVARKDGQVYFVSIGEDLFPVKSLPAPECSIAEARAAYEQKKAEAEAYADTLAARREELPELQHKQEQLESELRLYLAACTGNEAADDSLVIFEGFAPSEEDKRLEAEFDSLPCVWMREDAREEDNPPIKLRNNRFTRLFEGLTGMYGMPVYGEFDPTPVLAPFFLLFFALCMGDAGYGIVLILFGIAINKKWISISMFNNIGTLISVLGVATFIVGLILGCAFGVNLYELDFIPDSVKALMLPNDKQIAGYSVQMVLALGIGVLHICLAMIIKATLYTRRFGFKSAISSWGWVILVVGGLLTAAAAMFLNLPENTVKIAVIAIGAVSALAIFIFNKPGRNPLINIGAGLWDSYQMATGLLGDVLSYIRLYALGLAGGMLGGAFNKLGLMILGDSPTWHWFFFVLVLLLGHVLNLLMSCLGAFVHPLRLTFVEYFKNA
ncbi:MAG: ATPase V, partial [Bacteroidales bacterium]|nr:ATPase V [Bacteroidales bacterium]